MEDFWLNNPSGTYRQELWHSQTCKNNCVYTPTKITELQDLNKNYLSGVSVLIIL